MSQCKSESVWGRCELSSNHENEGYPCQHSEPIEISRAIGDKTYTFHGHRVHHWEHPYFYPGDEFIGDVEH